MLSDNLLWQALEILITAPKLFNDGWGWINYICKDKKIFYWLRRRGKIGQFPNEGWLLFMAFPYYLHLI